MLITDKQKEVLNRINGLVDIDEATELKEGVTEIIELYGEYEENKKRYEEIKDSDDDTDIEEKADLEAEIKGFEDKENEYKEKLNNVIMLIERFVKNSESIKSWLTELKS